MIIGQKVGGGCLCLPQVGDKVLIIDAIDTEIDIGPASGPSYVNHFGIVESLDYHSGCGQSFPNDPMIKVRILDTPVRSKGDEIGDKKGQFIFCRRAFWKEELKLIEK